MKIRNYLWGYCTLCGLCTEVCPQKGALDWEQIPEIIPSDVDGAWSYRTNWAPPIDHVAILQDLQNKANKMID